MECYAQDLAADEQQPETVENAKEMWEALSRQCPAPMLEVVMNHGSFAQTIENLFALSFLVRRRLPPRHDARVAHVLSLSFLPESVDMACCRCRPSCKQIAAVMLPPLDGGEYNHGRLRQTEMVSQHVAGSPMTCSQSWRQCCYIHRPS